MKKNTNKRKKNLWAGRFEEVPSDNMAFLNASIAFSISFLSFSVARLLSFISCSICLLLIVDSVPITFLFALKSWRLIQLRILEED